VQCHAILDATGQVQVFAFGIYRPIFALVIVGDGQHGRIADHAPQAFEALSMQNRCCRTIHEIPLGKI
jgi:hypothetical protein